MKTSRKIALVAFINIGLLTVGPLSYFAYNCFVSSYPDLAFSLFEQRSNVATVLATFAFTMLGFLAAVITILFSISQSRVFRKYRDNGYLSIFFSIYFGAIFCLLFTFLFAVLALGNANGLWMMRGSLIFMITSLAQIAVLLVIIVNLSHRVS